MCIELNEGVVLLTNSFSTQLAELSSLKDQMTQYRPLSEKQVAQLEQEIRVEHVWSSNAIEGNRMTMFETRSILNAGMTVHELPIKSVLETLDLGSAYDYMLDLVTRKQPLTQSTIRDLNRIATLKTADSINEAGVYRAIDVWPNGREDRPYTNPFDIRPAMDQLIAWAQTAQNGLHPVQYAAELHFRFVTIHPFVDGNGRTARLLMNFALLQSGYPIINVQPDQTSRTTYMQALEDGQIQHQSGPFINLIIAYVKAELLNRIKILKLNEQNIADAHHEN